MAAVLLSVASAWAQSLAVTTLASSGLNVPTGVAADSAGNVYVADTSSHSIKKITSAGVVSTLAGTGSSGSTNAGAGSTFNAPRALTINSAGTILYVADTGNNMIRQITLSAQGGSVSSVTTVDSSMNGPRGITINSSDDTLYVSNLNTATISKIVLSGPTVTTIVNAGITQPMGLVLNAAGTVLYVADASANLIRSVTLSGPTVATYAGNGTAALTDNATATSASFSNPIGLSIDASDNLYVADAGNNAIRTIAAAGSHAVVTVAGGTSGFVDGTGSAARFLSPNGIAVKTLSGVQYEFIADTGNNAVRKASLPVAPSVSNPSSQSVVAGATNVTFTAAATAGWPTPTLQWQRNPNGTGIFADVPNTSPYSGVTSGTLTISTVTSGMNGDTFRLVATNSTGSASSSVPATLTVTIPPTAPSFATSTVTFNATVGQANTFNTAVTAGTAPITYSVTSGSRGIFLLDTSTGVITGNPSSTAESTVFTITASNGTLPNATRTVTINAVITAAPSISTQPQNQTVTAGASTATFSVSATGSPAITGYQWERQVGGSGSFVAITDGATTGATFSGATTATLSLSSVTPAANGDVYRVQITNSVGTTQSSTATLTVQGTVPQIGTTPSSASADAGNNATFTATATGNPSPTIRWQRQAAGTSGFVDLSDGGSYSGTGTTTLTVTSVSAGMNGDQFRLAATNTYGTVTSNAATLTINSLVPLISVAPQNTTVNIAQNATFTASATGNPSPSLRWQRQAAGTFGFVDLSDDATYGGTTSNTLTVISPTAGMNGDQFRVVATNTNGTTPSASATLTVSSSAPAISANPTSVIANIGQTVTFSGNATGNPSPGFRWQRQAFGTSGFVDLSDDGTYSGTAATTLTITAVTAGMTGDQFRLVASNVGGSTPTTAATLTVNLGTTFTTFAGTPNFPGAVDATGAAARFSSPAAIAVDSSGNFYIADTGNSIIRKMTSNGVVTTLAGTAGSRGSVDGTGAAARFNSPTGIAVDGVGNVYVSDTFNHTIRTITPAGVVTTLAGTPSASGAVNDVGAAARFFLPAGLVVTPNGTLYVADSSNHAIRRITTDGTVTTFAGGLAVPGFVDNASGLSARFNAPNALALDSSGNLYVADSQNNAIRKITPGGSVSTFAGSLVGTLGSADGNGTAATFNRPSGISVDSSGYVYVADTNNNILRKITPSGEVTLLAGLAGVFGSADGVGTAARFNRPFGIVVDANSNIYVADTGNHIIRRSGSTVAVAITTQPSNQGAAIGQNVSFNVVATGTPTPTGYQWQREAAGTSGFVNLGSSSTYGGVTTATLTITNVTSVMQGDRFRVVVANGVNPAATSDAATLSIGTPVTITSANAATFQAGIANSFTVTTDSSSGVTFSATGLPSWATINSSTGVLSGTPPNTTGSPLTFTLIANNGVPATQTFTLTISPANLPPTVASQPANTAVNPGATATFTVSAGGSAPFTYQWRRNGIALAGATDPTLTLANVQAANAGAYSVVITNAAGSTTSAGATLTVNTVPVITVQPRPQVSILGGGATFSVAATGSTSFTYQWRKNGIGIAGANGETLSLSGLTAADAGNYDVIVTNASGSVLSSVAQLTLVTAASAPVITLQPVNRTVVAGSPVTLAVAAAGAPSPTFQWRRNGVAIAGATSANYGFANVQGGDAANYDVVITNSAGSVTSATVGLRVLIRSSAGVYFGNLSNNLGTFALFVRDDNTGVFLAYLPGSTAPIVSLNLTVTESGQFSFSQNAIGAASVSDEPARAAALAPVTVTGTIASDGTITGVVGGGANALLTGARASDTGPTQGLAGFYQAGGTNTSSSAYTIVGGNGQAFVVVQAGANSDGGTGTVTNAGQVSLLTTRSVISETINGATGVITGSAAGGVSAPSLTGASDVTLARQRLINISSRARVATGDSVAIAGFVISGQESKPVLIRAVGPTLGAAPFNLPGALASPKLELFRGSTSIASNTGIGTNRAAIDAAGVQVGAFTLGAAGTDAAIVTTLAPGNYTAIVSSTTNTAGVALIEVYDLSGPTAGQKLLNISTRASAGTAENTLIAGFVVPPGAAKRVLVRGVGPGLTPLGVTGALTNPALSVLSGSTVIGQNTNWVTSTDAALITTSSAQVGAFGLSTNDSAVILTLAPGNYTAQVTGVGGATGVALIEVYELP